jgi:hypothetical protein
LAIRIKREKGKERKREMRGRKRFILSRISMIPFGSVVAVGVADVFLSVAESIRIRRKIGSVSEIFFRSQ